MQLIAAQEPLVCIKGADACGHFLQVHAAKNPRALVIYLHGIEGHAAWFENTALFLQSSGISSLALDRRGSGRSQERRGDIQSWQVLESDLSYLIGLVKKEAGSLPVFLMANCWSAKLAAVFCRSQNPLVQLLSGLILSSPAIYTKVDLDFKSKLRVAAALLLGDKNPIKIPLQVEDFTDNPSYLNYIRQDKLRLTEASPSFFFNTFLLGLKAASAAEKIHLPVLVLQSGNDSIVDLAKLQRWFMRLSSTDKEIQVYEGVKHSLDFDANPAVYRNKLKSWIDERSFAPSPGRRQ